MSVCRDDQFGRLRYVAAQPNTGDARMRDARVGRMVETTNLGVSNLWYDRNGDARV